MEKIGETELSVVTASLDIQIQDFVTCSKEVCEYLSKDYLYLTVHFSATVLPKCVEEDWLSVRVRVIVQDRNRLLEIYNIKWAVSMIDNQDRTWFTRYFENPCSSSFLIHPKKEFFSESLEISQVFDILSASTSVVETAEATCLEKSFILNRAEEFLTDGVLFLRCDISVDTDEMVPLLHEDDTLGIFIRSIPQVVCYKNGAESEILSDPYTVFDFTEQVLILPQFHDLRKRYGVYGLSPGSASNSLELKQDITDVLEHIWIFDTRSDRFLLSLAPNPSNVGHRLVNESSVIRRCVKAPMKEQREKRVVFPDVESKTFQIVLHFLKSGEIKYFDYYDVLEVYKFSHLYEMEILQLKCAPLIAYCETETQHEEMEKLAELCEDTYLFRLLQAHKRQRFGNNDILENDDRLDFDFYN